MTLAIGFAVGKYEVLELLAAGGMGEVFRARDVALGREVALKVLPLRFAMDEQRRARFVREAGILSALNHANIATLYEVVELDGAQALVLELIEGETLADRIARAPLGFREVVDIARQIAAALECAHDKNIVHRDLKPENVKLRPDGQVKVVDFGLAKIIGDSREPPGAGVTATSLDPFGGAVLGTPAYMSPEQARGLTVDQRSDVWAFGCVLFEMLTRRRAFAGATASDTLVSILEREPDWPALGPDCPPEIDRLLRRCLAKERAQRLRHIGDAALDLADVVLPRAARDVPRRRGRPEPEPAADRHTAFAPWRRTFASRRALMAGGLAVAVAAAVPFAIGTRPIVTVGRRRAPERVDIDTPRTNNPHYMAVAPHGRRVAYVGDGENGLSLWIRSLDSEAAFPLPGVERASTLSYPFWSPDGRYVALRVGADLVKVDVARGEPETIARTVGLFRRGAWSVDGEIIFASDVIKRVRAGRSPAPVTQLARGETAHSAPAFLPDGVHFLYKATAQDARKIYVGSLAGEEPVPLLEAARALYVQPGFILFTRRETLFAQPFAAERLELTGEAVALVDGVYYVPTIDTSAFDASLSGSVAVRHAAERGNVRRHPITVFTDWRDLLDAPDAPLGLNEV